MVELDTWKCCFAAIIWLLLAVESLQNIHQTEVIKFFTARKSFTIWLYMLMSLMVYKALHELEPSYLQDVLVSVSTVGSYASL